MRPSSRHPGATILSFEGHSPDISPSAFVAPGVTLIGKVRLEARAGIWYGSILRGDNDDIVIGEESNVQDASVLHTNIGFPTILGKRVTVGHGAIIHGATLEDDVLVGMRAVVLDGAVIGTQSLVAAGAIVTPGTQIPPRSLVVGMPAKVLREVRDKDLAVIQRTPDSYVDKARRHRDAVAAQLGSGEMS